MEGADLSTRCPEPVKYVVGSARYHVCPKHLQLTISVASKVDAGNVPIKETGGIHTPEYGEYEDRLPEFREIISMRL